MQHMTTVHSCKLHKKVVIRLYHMWPDLLTPRLVPSSPQPHRFAVSVAKGVTAQSLGPGFGFCVGLYKA